MKSFYKSLRKRHSNRKMGKRFDPQFTKEDIQCSIDIWKGAQQHWLSGNCKLKPQLRHRYTFLRMAKIKKP